MNVTWLNKWLAHSIPVIHYHFFDLISLLKYHWCLKTRMPCLMGIYLPQSMRLMIITSAVIGTDAYIYSKMYFGYFFLSPREIFQTLLFEGNILSNCLACDFNFFWNALGKLQFRLLTGLLSEIQWLQGLTSLIIVLRDLLVYNFYNLPFLPFYKDFFRATLCTQQNWGEGAEISYIPHVPTHT